MRRLLECAMVAATAGIASAQQPPARAGQPRMPPAGPTAAARRPAPVPRALSPVEQRIQAVEKGLLPTVRVKGRPLTNMTLAARMRIHGVSAVSVAVIDNFGIEWARGYGVDTAATFLAGAAGKPVIAMVAMAMVQDKKLDLDRDAGKTLKTWKLPRSDLTRSKKLTPRALLSHTGGLPEVPLDEFTPQSVPTLGQLLHPLALDQVPTLEYRRNGADYLILEQLLADAGRKPFPDLARELVFGPLGMTRSAFGPPLPAALMLETTPSDLARFALEVQNAMSGRGGRVLRRQSAQLMLTPPPYAPEGLGLHPSGGDSALRFTHRGRTGESETELVAFVNHGQGAVVMARRGPGSGQLVAEILNSVAKTYGWLEYLPPEKTVAVLDPRVFDRYAGKYAAGERTASIARRSGKLFFVEGRISTELTPESMSEFFSPDGATYSFVFDENSRVSAMTVRRRDGDRRWDRQ